MRGEVRCARFVPSGARRHGRHEGARCLEIGAGNGSIAHWLARRELSAEDLDRYQDLMMSPTFRGWFYQLVYTRGRKPDHPAAV